VEHTTRIAFQGKTRRELSGNFFGDYKRSLRIPDTWDDGDSGAVNYVGHPVHGAASGFIWLDHEDGSHDPKLGFSKEYWASCDCMGRGVQLPVRIWSIQRGVARQRRLTA
jgi:hypothetical protein